MNASIGKDSAPGRYVSPSSGRMLRNQSSIHRISNENNRIHSSWVCVEATWRLLNLVLRVEPEAKDEGLVHRGRAIGCREGEASDTPLHALVTLRHIEG